MSKGKLVDLKPGDRYGFLVIIQETDCRLAKSGQRCRRVLCRCDCGNQVDVDLSSLRHRRQPSCGCRRGGVVKHGWADHPLYKAWQGIIARCENQSDASYRRYGGRGIRVCEEWHDLDTFVAWGLSNGWQRGLQIDRRDNDGDYCPDNCHFVTRKGNQRNTRHNHKLTHDGITLCLAAWAERLDMPYTTILSRLERGWKTEEALTRPVKLMKECGT